MVAKHAVVNSIVKGNLLLGDPTSMVGIQNLEIWIGLADTNGYNFLSFMPFNILEGKGEAIETEQNSTSATNLSQSAWVVKVRIMQPD